MSRPRRRRQLPSARPTTVPEEETSPDLSASNKSSFRFLLRTIHEQTSAGGVGISERMAHAGVSDSMRNGGRGHLEHIGHAWSNANSSPGSSEAPSRHDFGGEPQAVAGAISRNVNVYDGRRDKSVCPSLGRKGWLKPVSTLLRGIPDSKRDLLPRDFRGMDRSFPPPFSCAVHPLMIQQDSRGESRFSQHESFRCMGSDHPGVNVGPLRDIAAMPTPPRVGRFNYERLTMAVEVESSGRRLHQLSLIHI